MARKKDHPLLRIASWTVAVLGILYLLQPDSGTSANKTVGFVLVASLVIYLHATRKA